MKDISGLSEQGFLGLAFHPNYSENGYFYVNYINNSNNTVIARFSRLNANLADPSSEEILLTIPQPFANHNGGQIRFGVDGHLYIAVGDGGSGGDPQNNAQDLSVLLGKILRIDVDQVSADTNYSIPHDNPFIDDGDMRDEIWSYGLRNPWKFSFDRLNGDLWIGDVGQNSFEEINQIQSNEAGINFGWRCYEGNATFNLESCPSPSSLVFPIAEYANGSRCAITGGFRYRGSQFPNFEGLYFFADYCSNEIGMLSEIDSDPVLQFSESFTGNNWSSFGEDSNGELYVAGIVSGSIYKIVDNEVLGIKDNLIDSFKVYPNPVLDHIVIDLGEGQLASTTIAIYDLSLRKIKSLRTDIDEQIQLNLKELDQGLYILQIQLDNNKSTSFKFLKL